MSKSRNWPRFIRCASYRRRAAKRRQRRWRPGNTSLFAGWKAILAEEPAAADVSPLAQPQPLSDAFWYLVSRLIQVVALDRFHLHVRGIEKLPQERSLHSLVQSSELSRSAHSGQHSAARECSASFRGGNERNLWEGFMLWLARSLRVVVVDPDANLIPAMRAGAFGLRQGRPLILYPEGERSIDGTPEIFKKGAAILSIHLQVPIVPIAIEGFYEVWPRNKPFHGFKPLKIVFGDPIFPPPESEASEAAYEKLTAELKARVVGMWEAACAGNIRHRIESSSLLRPRMRLIVNLQHMLHRQLRVALRGREAFMAEQLLNRAQVGAFLQHVRAEGMAQSVRMHIRGKTFRDRNLLDDAADAARGQPSAALIDQQSARVLLLVPQLPSDASGR